MLTKDLSTSLTASIGEEKSPAHRINILMPVLACLFLAAWVITLVTGSTKNFKSENKECRAELQQLRMDYEKLRSDMQRELNASNDKRFIEAQQHTERMEKIYNSENYLKTVIDKKLMK